MQLIDTINGQYNIPDVAEFVIIKNRFLYDLREHHRGFAELKEFWRYVDNFVNFI